eukprot:8184164-Heterocapsa_arctica.AAC.1
MPGIMTVARSRAIASGESFMVLQTGEPTTDFRPRSAPYRSEIRPLPRLTWGAQGTTIRHFPQRKTFPQRTTLSE